ncbi:hypothetical protein M406DRAFT_331403 [Cryphonectria parasitica EP155]|uniref:Uncharacterized protein n=1 Tax=Cryphonectria parasitica (strain ATCC 38755 / EP155) TaxID=660469 RepID=A0A9P5CN55_CRYP1|nr:uncharacterized protein M406DRAFT_331403 [Cryphonectria parasitica EP155]KAF3765094.1 hypothetical protein M406DRAFT_331403 [Cryphonectria parasitica EP155]
MEANITVDVQDYRLAFPNGQSPFLLQSPVQHDGERGGMLLVRQDLGANNNEVSFKLPENLIPTNDPPHGTHAHGILLQSDPGRRYLKGDLVWLRDLSWNPGSNLDPSKIKVVNLRTWEDLVIDLQAACWVPRYRKLDHRANEQEVLTISGPPKRNANDKKLYVLAIVQRLSQSNEPSSASAASRGSQLEIKELVEKELFKYQNLSISPDGRRTAEKLFRWALTGVLQSPINEYSPLAQQTPLSSLPTMPSLQAVVPESSASGATPANADNDMIIGIENDPDFDRDAEELWAKGMAVLNKQSTIIEPICNLPKDTCPTPPRTFFITNRPSVDNPYPTHHHRLDHECPIGAAHEIHCVFPSPQIPLCIIPCTIKHQCCTTSVWPRNKSINKPSTVISLPIGDQGGVIVRGGSGVTRTQPDNHLYSDLPIAVKPMGFDARWNNDEMGRRAYGVGEREDIVDGEWNFATASLDGAVEDVNPNAASEVLASDKGGGNSQEDPDVFGDRHFFDEFKRRSSARHIYMYFNQ